MSKIKVTSKCAIYDGMSLTFKAPCNSEAVDGINIYYGSTSTAFTFRDAHGVNLASKADLFTSGAYVKVVLNTTNMYAYLQNADTNNYLETKLASKLSLQVSSENAGKYLKVASDGTITYENPVAKFSQGPVSYTHLTLPTMAVV